MAHKKRGHLTTATERAKHLRKYLKNQFWRGERSAGKRLVREELSEAGNLKWQFEELVKTLVAMSLPLEDQREFYGIGVVADEMLEEFYTYYVLNKKPLLEQGLINAESKTCLDDIEVLSTKWTSEKEESFWFEMDKYQKDWDVLREKAMLTLRRLEKGDLTVAINHQNELDEEGNIISQHTNIELKKKE